MHCNASKHTATHCNKTLQHATKQANALQRMAKKTQVRKRNTHAATTTRSRRKSSLVRILRLHAHTHTLHTNTQLCHQLLQVQDKPPSICQITSRIQMICPLYTLSVAVTVSRSKVVSTRGGGGCEADAWSQFYGVLCLCMFLFLFLFLSLSLSLCLSLSHFCVSTCVCVYLTTRCCCGCVRTCVCFLEGK